MPRRAAEVADLFRRYGEAYRQQHGCSLSTAQRRVMTAIEQCRTAALGGHVEQCDTCGHATHLLQFVPLSPPPKVPVPGPCRVVGGSPIRTPDHALLGALPT